MVLLSPAEFLLLFSLVTSIKGITPGSNDTGEINNEPRSIKRQVKLYSGVRSKPIICNEEGFQEDPVDCSIFHRCVRSGKGRFVSFRFQCSPGTIYDPDAEICNHPEKTKRVACGGKNNRTTKQTKENEINQEIPRPISTKEPVYIKGNQKYTLSTFKPPTSYQETFQRDTKYPWQYTADINFSKSTSVLPLSSTKATPAKRQSLNSRPTTPKSISFNNHGSTSQSGEICTSDGFMGDSENCRKFYRCVGNQRGGFIRYEFLCSDPTIWDEDKQACNYDSIVKRRRCGRGNVIDNDIKNDDDTYKLSIIKPDESVKTPESTQTQTQINYGSRVTQTQSQISNGSVNQNQTQINYGNGQDTKQNQTQISYGTAVSQSQSQINYGDKVTQTQLQIDHANGSSQMQSQVAESSSSTTTIPTSHSPPIISSTTKPSQSSNECTESGFIGDSNDCKKFYRCVDNGRGSYTRYEFSCGEGTVWDPNLESCNHAWAVKECGGKATVQSSQITTQSPSTSKSSTTQSSTTSSTQSYYTPENPYTEEENEIPYQNQQTSTTTGKPFSSTTTVSKNDNQCQSSGFFGDNNDCKKFYRCVDNGNGQYTRYEFSCGEGTVWDSKIEACNHAWAVEKCGGNGNQNNNIEKDQTTTPKATQVTYTPSSSTSQVSHQNDDNDTGYGSQQDDSTSETVITLTTVTTTGVTTTTTTTEVPHNQGNDEDNTCKNSGFIGDNKDCKKFYRCVDNGNGEYTRYEFSCGEGTVWDPKLQVCNHAWAVEKCGGSATNEIETSSHKESTTTTTTTTTTPQSLTTDDEVDVGYGQQSSTTSTTTESQPQHINNNQCTSSGFIGDSNDCKKFYRCVENGNGGFTKYEFTCGEGTVWDSEIDACNHAWAVKKCGSTDATKNPEYTSSAQPILNDQDNQGGYPAQNDEYNTEKPGQSTIPSMSTSTSSNTGTKVKCQNSGFMGDPIDCKKFYRCVEDGRGGYIQYEFTCGEGTAWDQSIDSCNHESAVSNCHHSGSHDTTSNIESSQSTNAPDNQEVSEQSSTLASSTISTSKPSSSICMQQGFYGDENNCKNFYRCVDDGKGGYTKYDFTCGEGTVWNQEIQGCDHESADISCKVQVSSSSSTKKPDWQNDEYTESTSTTYAEHNTKPVESQPSEDKCKQEGFYGDSKNCKKFYRCVDNGKGGYTKYEFTCGEGTVWVQEIQACDHDNGVTSCAGVDSTSTQQPIDQPQYTTQSTSQSQVTDKENGEDSVESSTKPTQTQCTSEGFYGNKEDCTKFYRCVDNGQGGFTKYEFTCGEGTAWDSDLQTCNHISEVRNCNNSNQQEKPIMHDEEVTESPESTNTTNGSSSPESSSSNKDVCDQEGFHGNTEDCTKFYRCVDNGKGGFIKYDFDCGEGTIWDQDLTTCNHPQNVVNPSCKNNDGGSSSTESSSNNENNTTSCSQESSSSKPENQKVKCEKAGFYADPDDCKKFYRCVDWDGNGERFSIYHFECGEGTIWDPQLDTCNHEDSVYPPRNCSGSQNQGEKETTTTEKTTTQESTTSVAETTTTTENSTTQQSTSSEQTTSESTTTEPSTTQSTTSEPVTTESTTASSTSTTEQSTTTEKTTTTTQQTTQEMTTNQQSTQTSEQTTTEQSTSSEATTTQQSTTSEITTTQQPTTSEQTTTELTTSSEQTTTQQSITEQTTTDQSTDSQYTTTQQTTTEQQMTTSEQTTSTTEQTEQTTTEQSTTEQQTTEHQITTTESTTQSTTTTTENDGTTTTESDQETTTGNKECPDTEDDQYLYVCPTSFRRHPKYCNMFYQCTEDDDGQGKIATFTCPNNTVYDESKIQCVEEDKADKKCNGQKVRRHRVKRLNSFSKDPIQVDGEKHTCTTVGYHPFEKQNECSLVFLKCLKAKSGTLRGYVYQCPENYVYWSISKKCEKRENMRHCQESSSKNWSNRWEIPIERRNVAK